MKTLFRALLAGASLASTAHAGFHIMEIEQIIGGLNGDTSAQAIQLRVRGAVGDPSQPNVAAASIWVSDAAGANRVLLLNINSNVAMGTPGSHILLTTSAFTSTMVAGGATNFSPDFTLLNRIPAADLAAGKITFEQDGGDTTTPGFVYWSVAWGGASFTGTNFGGTSPTSPDTTNDTDGFFGDNLGHGSPFASALPSGSLQGLIFKNSQAVKSTNNASDYQLSANPATVTKNNGTAFTVVPEPGSVALVAIGAASLGGFAFARRRQR